ncbi:hypothetical protein Salat_1924300 [Sesamum alatum]|uniref:Uncharacterized protein n=1 Tax=Sesamum alatum TaxID=300844 RepID=A0AAE1Y454_9LAMI|nr:hypothetical protein Salat_1924300 [Sesamum alatum]
MDLVGITSQRKGLVLRPRTDSGQSTADPTRSPKIQKGYEGPRRDGFEQRRATRDLAGITSQRNGLVLRPRTDSGQSTTDPTRSPKTRENPKKIKQNISYEAAGYSPTT